MMTAQGRYEQTVITGIGVVLPDVTDAAGLWRSLRGGRSHLSTLPAHIRGTTGVHAGGQICRRTQPALVPELPARFAAKYSREIHSVLAALVSARGDAGLDRDGVQPDRMGVLGSSSRGPVDWLGGGRQGDPLFASLPGAPVSMGAIHLGARGIVTTISNACVGGNQAVLLAADQIELGRADVVYVVGYEFPLVPAVMDIYTRPSSRVLSRYEDAPRAVRPYDRERDGFALGEGAIALVLERRSHADRRNAMSYAAITSGITVNEAAHATRMDMSGLTTARMMEAVLSAAGMSSKSLDYVCGHGTATHYNDLSESRALKVLLGPRRTTWPPLGSVKPNFGHLLGAAGVLNAAATALMVHHQTLAPTINLSDPEPECDHDHVGEGSRETPVRCAMSLAFAIGSQSSALLLETA